MQKIGIVLIGYGGMGSIYAEMIRKSKDAELLYVLGTKKEKLEKFIKEKCENSKPIYDLSEALKDDKVKGVIIASPSDTHYKYIMESIKSGRSVLCEKPFITNLEQTEECYRTAKEKNVTLLTAFMRRYDESFSQLKKKLEEKIVGNTPEVIKITSRDPNTDNNPQEKSHPVWDSMSHDFDMALWLAGELEVESAYCVQPTPESLIAVIKFENGTIATIDWAKGISYGYDQRVEVHCSGGMIQVHNQPISLVKVYDKEGKKSDKLQPFFTERYHTAYEKQTNHFLQCIKDPSTKPMVTDKQVIAGTKIALMALDSIKKTKNDNFLSMSLPKFDKSLEYSKGKIEAKEIGICIIGAGKMGNIRADLISKEDRYKLLYIVDIDAKEGNNLAKRYGCKFTKDLSEALSDKNVHAVWITVNLEHHMQYIRDTMNHKKHIYCETPISDKSKEVEEAYKLAKENEVLLMCGWSKRFDDQYKKVFEIVKEEKSGPSLICLHNGEHPTLSKQTILDTGCVLRDSISHEIDLSLWISNQVPSSVYAVGNTFLNKLKNEKKMYDTGVVVMTFPDGSASISTARRNSPHGYDQRLEVLTKKGSLIQADNTPITGLVTSGYGKENMGSVYSKIQNSFMDRFYQAFFNEIIHFADVLLEGVSPSSTYQQNHLSSFISDMSQKSCDENKAILLR